MNRPWDFGDIIAERDEEEEEEEVVVRYTFMPRSRMKECFAAIESFRACGAFYARILPGRIEEKKKLDYETMVSLFSSLLFCVAGWAVFE